MREREATLGRNGEYSVGHTELGIRAGDLGLRELTRETKWSDLKGNARKKLANICVQGISDRRIYKRDRERLLSRLNVGRKPGTCGTSCWEAGKGNIGQDGGSRRGSLFGRGDSDSELEILIARHGTEMCGFARSCTSGTGQRPLRDPSMGAQPEPTRVGRQRAAHRGHCGGGGAGS